MSALTQTPSVKRSGLRVLTLLPGLRVSTGVASWAMNYFRRLDHSLVHMDFALYWDTPSPYFAEIEAAGAKTRVLPPVSRTAEHIRECRRILREGAYDIIHNNSLLITYPMMLCAEESVPVRILHSHSTRLGENPWKEKRNKLFLPLLQRTATDFAACSSPAGKAMFGERPFSLVPNVVDTEKYRFQPLRRAEVRARMNAGGKYVIGTVGRTAEPKNPFFAMEVFLRVAQQDPDAEYWWIGSGPLDGPLRTCIAQLGLSGRVRLLGSREDVPDLYQAMDCLFMPSRFEGVACACLEAQTAGLPCVASAAASADAACTDLVEAVSLSEGPGVWAGKLLSKKNLDIDRRVYARQMAESPFSDKQEGEFLAGLYRKMLDAK